MTTSTRETLRQLLMEMTYGWHSFAISGTGGAAGATALAVSAADIYPADDKCAGFFAILPDGPVGAGASAYEWRKIASYTATSGTITPTRAFSAQVTTAGSNTVEITPVDPTAAHSALNRAGEHVYAKGLYLPLTDENVVIDDILSNAGVETWTAGASAAPDGWTLAGAGASVAREGTRKHHGLYSAALTSGGGAAGQLTQNRYTALNQLEVNGKTVTYKKWVWADAASTARLRITDDGSTYSSSSYHTGSAGWELLSVTHTVSSATQLTFVMEVAAGGETAYFDAGFATVDPLVRITLPSTMVDLDNAWVQYASSYPDGEYKALTDALRLGHGLTGKRLRLEGRGYLSATTADSSTVEVVGTHRLYYLTVAAMYLSQSLMGNQDSSKERREKYEADHRRYTAEVEMIERSPGFMRPVPYAARRRGWYTTEDANGRYLNLAARRDVNYVT